ncbi:S-layer homology domain-containing protein [Vallitalea guaymasensis]|uniref:S-layer homology domain-containing protein n=1 Tax=Vallitalea guaymasensis TaxID=1185412 RepID=A0A8J8MCY6_9FIRM|nr:S-layer homology domain-containing protein [Vallitalea guaymasensis]QUH30677.1 S-layer homology domain-containing protein [Vallitalea guaymasensis]
MKNKKLARIITMVLVFSLILSNAAMAKNDNNKGNRGKSKVNWNYLYKKHADQYKTWEYEYTKKFQDVEKEHWANKDIERMSAKNYILGNGNGKFLPNKPTKNIEVLAMILRIMGWEDDAKELDEIPEIIESLDIPEWSVNYLAYAYIKGIITEDELKSFEANGAAKRYVVAKYIVRALGLNDKALDNDDEDLDFDDEESIPEGNNGYIYLINKLGLMSGFKNMFNPNGNLTRAEMAILFSRLDDKVDCDKDEVEMGEFVEISNGIITIKDDYESERYLLNENVVVYDIDGKEIKLTDLQVGDKLQLEFFDHKVVYIEVFEEEDDKILQTYKGKVTKVIETEGDKMISILVNEEEDTFVLNQDTAIKKEGQDDLLNFNDIKIGDIVKITRITEGDDSYISEIEIQVEEIVTKVYEGIVMALTETTTNKLVTIRQDDDKEKTFIVDENTVIKKEGQDDELEVKDIKIGDIVKVTEITEGDSVNVKEIEIQIDEPVVKVYEGKVVSIAETVDEKLITVNVGEESNTFSIGEETIIKDHGEDAEVEDISLEDKVRVTEITEGDEVKIALFEIID